MRESSIAKPSTEGCLLDEAGKPGPIVIIAKTLCVYLFTNEMLIGIAHKCITCS